MKISNYVTDLCDPKIAFKSYVTLNRLSYPLSSHDVSAIFSNCNPSALYIVFSSYGTFLLFSAPAIDSMLSTCVMYCYLNPSNAELNPICHLLALLEAHHILHVSRIRGNLICGLHGDMQWRSWLRHCTTSQKVAGSIPNGALEFFY